MSIVAAISVLRSAATTARISAVRLTGVVKPRTAPSPFRISSHKPLSARMSPVEMSSISVVSMLPYHSATTSAVLTSMLSIAPLGHGWSIEGDNLKQRPTLECGFYVCRYMKEIIKSDDPYLEKMYGGGPVRDKYYSQAQYDEVLDDWSQFVYSHLI
ncbi:hypothetical protein OROHE_008364 [Orobanche hederae]